MKLTSLLCLLSAFIATEARAQYESTTPGVIVYARDGHPFQWSFKDQKEKSLTNTHITKAKICWPFGASANGEWICWPQLGKIWVVHLPEGTPYAIEYYGATKGKGYDREIPFYFSWDGNNILAVSLSPNGERCSIESLFERLGWVLTNPGNPVALARITAGVPKQVLQSIEYQLKIIGTPNVTALPEYAFVNRQYWGIFCLSTIYNKESNAGGTGPAINHSEIYRPTFGNAAEHPNAIIFRATPQDLKNAYVFHGGNDMNGTPLGIGTGGSGQGEHLYGNNCIERSAHFLTYACPEMWEGGKRFVYFLFQAGNQWVLEIRLLSSDIYTDFNGDNCNPAAGIYVHGGEVVRAWEIPIDTSQLQELSGKPIVSCEGLAIKPDGSPTISLGGNWYLMPFYEIEKGMEASDVNPVSEKNGKHALLDYTNNTFKVNLTLLDKGLVAKCRQWTSNEESVFLDKDNELCRWKKGVVEKLHYAPHITGGFWYCVKSPFETPTALGHGTFKAKMYQYADTGDDLTAIKAGYIMTNWLGLHDNNILAYVCASKIGHQKPLLFCKTNQTKFSDVDVSKLHWKNEAEYREDYRAGYIQIHRGDIFVLRDGDKCSLIKPTKIDSVSTGRGSKAREIMCVDGWLYGEWEGRILDSNQLSTASDNEKLATADNVGKKPGRKTEHPPKTKVASSDASEKPTNKWSQLYHAREHANFSVGGVTRFRWDNVEEGSAMLMVPENEPKIGIMQKLWVKGRVEDIDDPSIYFKDMPFPERGMDQNRVSASGNLCEMGGVYLVRYSQLEDKYFGVELVETTKAKAKIASYKKRVWPDERPGPERDAAGGAGETR